MREGKAAIRSLGFWGSLGALGGVLGVFREVLDIWNSIPPEVVQAILEDGKAVYFSILALVGSVTALIGRLKADSRISGLFRG